MAEKIRMMLGSMDHSPSEQLGDDPTQWHTTALILSEGGEHWDLGTDLARRIGDQSGILTKWSRKKDDRRAAFERTLIQRAVEFPVHIRAISAEDAVIRASIPHMLAQLGLPPVRQVDTNGKRRWIFGPFIRRTLVGFENGAPVDKTAPTEFVLPDHQAIPLIFVSHFVLRMHQQTFRLLRADSPELEWVDWQLSPNKFPRGQMASLFHALMSGAAHAKLVLGNVRILTFTRSRDDEGSTLADNIAGLLTEKLKCRDPSLAQPALVGGGSSFVWERWEKDSPEPA